MRSARETTANPHAAPTSLAPGSQRPCARISSIWRTAAARRSMRPFPSGSSTALTSWGRCGRSPGLRNAPAPTACRAGFRRASGRSFVSHHRCDAKTCEFHASYQLTVIANAFRKNNGALAARCQLSGSRRTANLGSVARIGARCLKITT